jgi:hypothetical protein
VEGGCKDSFHPSNRLFIGLSAHRWKDGGIFSKLVYRGEKRLFSRGEIPIFIEMLPFKQNDIPFEAKRYSF